MPPEPAVQVPLSVLQSATAENVPSAANAIVYFGCSAAGTLPWNGGSRS